MIKTEQREWPVTRKKSQNPLHAIQKRYPSTALITALIVGAPLMIAGYTSLGKGLILGTLFSMINFLLMALALPYRLKQGRGKSVLIALTSIYCRFALMAIPLIYAAKHREIAFSTVAVGLFMIPLMIVGEQIWLRWRNPKKVGI